MTKSAAAMKSRVVGEAAEEPPGVTAILSEDEEPPSTTTGTARRNRFFNHIPEELWNDWKWQFRNRVTTTDELTKFIPLSTTEQERLKLVSATYPIAITPYYLSLINPEDTSDPIRKQAVPSFKEVAFAGMGLEDPWGASERCETLPLQA